MYSMPPLQLQLFDGTSNFMITQAINLSIHFPSSDITPMMFYVTPLDGSCFLILGHNWLTHHNPLIDWVSSSISFRSPKQDMPTPPCHLCSLRAHLFQLSLAPPIHHDSLNVKPHPLQSSVSLLSCWPVASKAPFNSVCSSDPRRVISAPLLLPLYQLISPEFLQSIMILPMFLVRVKHLCLLCIVSTI